MFCSKIVGKILLIPVWFILIIVGIIVKLVVNMVSIAKSFVVLGLVALVIGYNHFLYSWFFSSSMLTIFSLIFPGPDQLQHL